MPEQISSTCRLFADDTIVYREINSVEDTAQLQEDLAALECWEKRWGMSFNPTKCKIINITRKKKPLKEEPLENVQVASYLGVQIVGNLTWHNHVAKVATKGNKMLGFVRRNIKTSSKSTKTLANQTLVRPTLEFSSCIWSPHQNFLREDLEKVQRRAARYVCAVYVQKAPVTDMQKTLEWDTLEIRRCKSVATMGYKIVNRLVAIPATQLNLAKDSTRGNGMAFIQISTFTNFYKYSFFPALVKIWNSLPADLVSAKDLDAFKEGLSTFCITSIYP